MNINLKEMKYNGYGISGNGELKRALVNAYTKQKCDPKFKVEESAIKNSNGKCFYCGRVLFKESLDGSFEAIVDNQGIQLLAFDHLFPSANGNPLVCGNAVAACSSCNGEKSDESPFDYDQRRRTLNQPTLFKTRDEFITKVNEISTEYKENYPKSYHFGQRSEQNNLTTFEIDEYYQWMFNEISMNKGITENWNLTKIELHPSCKMFKRWIADTSELQRAFINKVINALVIDKNPLELMSTEFIVSSIKETFIQNTDEYSSKSVAASARSGLKHLLNFITKDEVLKELRPLVYEEWEIHPSSDLFNKWLELTRQNHRPVVRKIINTLAREKTPFEMMSNDFIINVIDNVYKNYNDGCLSMSVYYNARNGLKTMLSLIDNDEVYEAMKYQIFDDWEVHPDNKLFTKMKELAAGYSTDYIATMNKLIVSLSADIRPLSERTSVELFDIITDTIDECVSTIAAKELIKEIGRKSLLEKFIFRTNYHWVVELIPYDNDFWMSLTKNKIVSRKDVVKAFCYFKKELESFSNDELIKIIHDYYNTEPGSLSTGKQTLIFIIKSICEYCGLNEDLIVASLDFNISSIYFDYTNILHPEDLNLIKNEYPNMSAPTISAINKLAIYLAHHTDDNRLSSITRDEWASIFKDNIIEPLKRVKNNLFNNNKFIVDLTVVDEEDINTSFWDIFLDKENVIYSESKGSSIVKNVYAAKKIKKEFDTKFKRQDIYSLPSSDIAKFFDSIAEDLNYETSMKAAMKRVMKLMAKELNFYWRSKPQEILTKDFQTCPLF